jgi:hypothetical protein
VANKWKFAVLRFFFLPIEIIKNIKKAKLQKNKYENNKQKYFRKNGTEMTL